MISALPTWFKGILFRSRLEAKWAEFFESHGFEWQYEPQGFKCGNQAYLCDFIVELDRRWYWVEVKPTLDFDRKKVFDFAVSVLDLPDDLGFPSGVDCVLVFIGPPSNYIILPLYVWAREGEALKVVEGDTDFLEFVTCPTCGQFQFYSGCVCSGCGGDRVGQERILASIGGRG